MAGRLGLQRRLEPPKTDFDIDSAASPADTPFTRLKYGFSRVHPLGRDTASGGPLWPSGTGMRTFGAAANKGQLGSAND